MVAVLALVSGIPHAAGTEEPEFTCNIRNIDAEIIVYRYKTSQLESLDSKDMILWQSLRSCLESYGLNPDNIAEISSDLKEAYDIKDSKNQGDFVIQDWMRDSVKRWVDDPKDVYNFAFAIEFISKTNVWSGAFPIPSAEASTPVVPEWYRSVAGWWLDDAVSDQEFIDSLEYLASNNIIRT